MKKEKEFEITEKLQKSILSLGAIGGMLSMNTPLFTNVGTFINNVSSLSTTQIILSVGVLLSSGMLTQDVIDKIIKDKQQDKENRRKLFEEMLNNFKKGE